MSYQCQPDKKMNNVWQEATKKRTLDMFTQKLHKEFVVYRYSRCDPVFVLDYTSNLDGYRRFLEDSDFSAFNESIQKYYPHGQSRDLTRTVYYDIPCIVRSDYELSLVQFTGTFLTGPQKDDDIRMIYSCSSVRLVRKYTEQIPYAYLEVPCQYECLDFYFGRTNDFKLKEMVYASFHNLFLIEDRMYLSADVTCETYPATYVADYLLSVTNYLRTVSHKKDFIVFTKIDIHSPGNILLYFENAVQFCSDNWPGMLLLFTLLFGGKVTTNKFTFESPSVRSFIEYISNWEHERKMKKEMLNQSIEKTKAMQLDNDIKSLEIETRRKQLQQHSTSVAQAAQKLHIVPARDNATDPNKIINYFPYDNSKEPTDRH